MGIESSSLFFFAFIVNRLVMGDLRFAWFSFFMHLYRFNEAISNSILLNDMLFTFVLNVMLWCWKQDPDCRESDHRAYWLARNHMILDCLLAERSSIICLQVCVLHLFNGLGCGKAESLHSFLMA